MKKTLASILILLCLGGMTAPVFANSEFDLPGKIYKRPVSGTVNLRSSPSPSSAIESQVTNGQKLMIQGGSCVNAKTGAEVDITIYKTKASLYKKLKSPNIFCQVGTFTNVVGDGVTGWIRGTHIMPASGFN
jgi:hypothetical protein